VVAHRPEDPVLELPRPPRFDQLPAERPQERLSDGREPQDAHAAKGARCLADQRIVREAPEELGVVVVDGQDEAKTVEAVHALGPQEEAPVDELACRCDLRAAVDPQSRGQRPVANATRRVARVPGAQCEGIRPCRPDDTL
jgi:hypothetical protein